MVRVEKVSDQRETALGVFLYTEGAFNNSSYDSTCAAMSEHGVHYTIIPWIRTTLEGQQATETLGGFFRSVKVSRDCPQGGVLSPLLWCLVVDELIASSTGVEFIFKDMRMTCLLAVQKIPKYDIRAHTIGPSYCRTVV
jgi:hypothetical protein